MLSCAVVNLNTPHTHISLSFAQGENDLQHWDKLKYVMATIMLPYNVATFRILPISSFILFHPFCLVLFASKSLVVVTLHFEQLLEVNFAVYDSLQGSVGSNTGERSQEGETRLSNFACVPPYHQVGNHTPGGVNTPCAHAQQE